jgi:hypothetical protein
MPFGPKRTSKLLYSERCREVARAEVAKSLKASAFSAAAEKLREPLANLDGLQGLPPELLRRCAVTMRGREALKLVPEALQNEWSEGALKKWTRAMTDGWWEGRKRRWHATFTEREKRDQAAKRSKITQTVDRAARQ